MQEINLNSNPLIRSVVHTSFRKATQNLGFAEIPKDVFKREVTPYLTDAGSIFDDSEASLDKLWNAVMRGEVILAEAKDDAFIFYVRGSVSQRMIDVRLVCRRQVWHVDSVVSMHHLPFLRWSWVPRSIFAVSVVLAGIIGYSIHIPHTMTAKSTHVLAVGNQQSGAATSTNVTNSTANTSVNVANSAMLSTANATSSPANIPSNATTKAITPTKPVHKSTTTVPKRYTFVLKPGMSIHDISVFLHAHNIIHEAAAKFDVQLHHAGIDRTILPGSYTFKAKMTRSQIFSVLRAGPKKS